MDRRTDGSTDRTARAVHGPAVPRSHGPPGPILAVDWGERRIGLAISDPERRVAHPLATLTRRTGRRFPMARLREHIAAQQPTAIVVGLPLESDGSEGPPARAARDAANLIAEKTGLEVTMVDERMTTARALGAVREMGGRTRERRGDVDQLAATVLLQTHLDTLRA